MPYVDGFVVVVPKKKVKAYVAMAKKAAPIFRELGALEFRECLGDDLATPMGRAFPEMAGAKRGETVFFSFITYKSRKHRDRVNAKVMKDPRMLEACGKDMPFDIAKMAYGGFEVAVQA
jgi:uncharacterized protein YbaA (DUF1428 family)